MLDRCIPSGAMIGDAPILPKMSQAVSPPATSLSDPVSEISLLQKALRASLQTQPGIAAGHGKNIL